MDLDSEPPGNLFFSLIVLSVGIDYSLFFLYFFLILLLVCSALMSGSEVAFFSLTTDQLRQLENENSENSKSIVQLRKNPGKLLTTILVGNYFFNILLILVFYHLLVSSINESVFLKWSHLLADSLLFKGIEIQTLTRFLGFLLSIAGVTLILILFGEVMPKIYANLNNLRLARFMVFPLKVLSTIFHIIISSSLAITSYLEEKTLKRKKNYVQTDKEGLEDALEITLDKDEQELDILKSILNFNDVSVKQIMKPRTDVIALDSSSGFSNVLQILKESGYSRIPVYSDDFDSIKGILFAKDLIPYLTESNDFEWQRLVRKHIYYVPESKKINEILKEFQKQKIHIAIVVDEYGGSSGLVTMEDIMEEILGDILDEFDEETEELDYIKVDDNTYIFNGKTSLLDFIKIFDETTTLFDGFKGESDSLAGTLLEVAGEIPGEGSEFRINKYTFVVDKTSERRIEQIKVIIDDN